MSKIVGIELENFMSIKKAKLVFDDSGIINLKGYNDSGKSAVFRALDVLMTNAHPADQRSFIRHGEDYFRVIVHFDDGVSILRDKYLKGSNLYEMYADGKVIFSTKVGNTLTKVTGVPLEIKEYLGLTETKEGEFLNFRSIYDKLFLVDTSGSENVELLNGVLKIKETSLATTAIKKDISATQSNINSLLAEIEANKLALERYSGLDGGFVSYLEGLDSENNRLSDLCDSLEDLESLVNGYSSLQSEFVTVPEVSGEVVGSLSKLSSLVDDLEDYPEVVSFERIDSDLVGKLFKLVKYQKSVEKLKDEFVDIQRVDLGAIKDIKKLYNLSVNYGEILSLGSRLSSDLESIYSDNEKLQEELLDLGVSVTACSNCNQLVVGVAGHVDL